MTTREDMCAAAGILEGDSFESVQSLHLMQPASTPKDRMRNGWHLPRVATAMGFWPGDFREEDASDSKIDGFSGARAASAVEQPGSADAQAWRRQEGGGRAWSLADVRVPGTDKQLAADGFSFRLRRVRRREGRYLLRSNMVAEDPATLWRLYIQLTEIEQAFKELKNDLAIRPIFHQRGNGSRHTSSSRSSPTACWSP